MRPSPSSLPSASPLGLRSITPLHSPGSRHAPAAAPAATPASATEKVGKVERTDAEWKRLAVCSSTTCCATRALSAFTGAYWNEHRMASTAAGCALTLFESATVRPALAG